MQPRKAVTAKTKVENPRLRTYLDAKKNDSVLVGEVDRWLQVQPNDRDATVIHPSEMSAKDWCHRSTWLRLTGRTPAVEPLTIRSALIFDTGHEIHRKWQHWLRGMGILWGRWECRICGGSVYEWSDALGGYCPVVVSRTIPHLWEYREVPLELSSHRIEGHADGVVNPTGDEPLLLEVKSIGPGTMRSLDLLGEHESDDLSSERFSKISRPLASHFMQTQVYLRLLENWKNEIGAVPRACIIYEHKADQKYREFVVTRNDKWTDPLFDAAMDIVWALDRGREVACNHGGCKRCAAYESED